MGRKGESSAIDNLESSTPSEIEDRPDDPRAAVYVQIGGVWIAEHDDCIVDNFVGVDQIRVDAPVEPCRL
jgi:hypothetical protein